MDSVLEQHIRYINTKRADEEYRVCVAKDGRRYSVSKVFLKNAGIDVLASNMTKNEVYFYLRGLSDGVNPLSIGKWD
jgi:hypothetical protein